MTEAVVAASRSTRAVRMTIPVRARGGWNFGSGSSNPSLGAVSRSRPDIMSTTPAASGSFFRTYSKVNAPSTRDCRLLPRCRILASELWVTSGEPVELVVEDLNAPGVRDHLTGLEHQQVVGGREGVRRAGHGLDGYRLATAVRTERVAGEHLEPAVALAGP